MILMEGTLQINLMLLLIQNFLGTTYNMIGIIDLYLFSLYFIIHCDFMKDRMREGCESSSFCRLVLLCSTNQTMKCIYKSNKGILNNIARYTS